MLKLNHTRDNKDFSSFFLFYPEIVVKIVDRFPKINNSMIFFSFMCSFINMHYFYDYYDDDDTAIILM